MSGKKILLTKSLFQKEKEEREKKLKKQAEEDAAAYESFVEAMQGDTKPKTFIRGGVIQKGADPSIAPVAVPAAGTEYRLEPRRPSAVPDAFSLLLPEDEPIALQGAGGGAKKTRELDMLLEELKSNPGAMASDRERGSAGRGPPGGGAYMGDSEQGTTNLCVNNLVPTVTEEALSTLFGRHGPLLSVKVMWPRNDAERERGKNTGFVMFAERADAEAALAALQGRILEGRRIELGWAKAVRAPVNAYGSTAPRGTAVAPPPPPTTTIPQHLLQKLAAVVAGSGSSGLTTGASSGAADTRPTSAAAAAPMAPAPPPSGGPSAPSSTLGGAAPPPPLVISMLVAQQAAAAAPGAGGPSTAGSTPALPKAPSHSPVSSPPPASAAPAPLPIIIPAGTPSIVLRRSGLRVPSGWGSRVPIGPPARISALAVRLAAACGVSVEDERPVPTDAELATSEATAPPGLTPVRVAVPRRPTRKLIDLWASFVAIDGTPLESQLLLREADNPDYAWLPESAAETPHGRYYRWRVYSLLQGDSMRRWRTRPFQFAPGGRWWVPPPCPMPTPDGGVESDDEAEDRDEMEREMAARRRGRPPASGAPPPPPPDSRWQSSRGRNKSLPAKQRAGGGELSPEDVRSLREGLAAASLERGAVCAGMVFALDRADCALQISAAIAESIREPGAPPPVLVARLYVAADVLHNCATPGVRNASVYRSALQSQLPDCFEALGRAFSTITGRLRREAMRSRVTRVLAAWTATAVFTQAFLTGLEAAFFRASLTPAVDPLADVWTALDAAANGAGGDSVAPLPAADIAERARLQGLSSEGGPVETLKRLAWLQEYTQQQRGGGGGRGSGAGSVGGSVGGLPSSLPAVTSSAAGSILAALLGQAPEPTPAPVSEATASVGASAMSESAAADPEGAAAPVTRGVKRRRRTAPKGGPASSSTSAWAAVDLEEEERQRKARRLESMERADESGAPSDSDEDLDGVPLVAPEPAVMRDVEAGSAVAVVVPPARASVAAASSEAPLVAMHHEVELPVTCPAPAGVPPVCEVVAAVATHLGPPQLAPASSVAPLAASECKGGGSDSEDIDGVPL